MDRMRRYLTTWFLCLIGVVLVCGVVNFLVDPYGVFGNPVYSGINRDKTQSVDQPFFTKTYLVERAHPKTIMVGSSRVNIGLDPESSIWPDAAKPVFNLGLPGGDLDYQYQYLEHALMVSRPSLIIVGVSFEDSFPPIPEPQTTAPKSTTNPNARLRSLKNNGAGFAFWKARFQDDIFALASLNAVTDSVATVMSQNNPRKSHETRLGQNNAGDFLDAATADGYRRVIEIKDGFRVQWLIDRIYHVGFDLNPLQKMIDLAASRGIKIVIFIPPDYIDEYELLKKLNYFGLYDNWKRDVTSVVGASHAAGKDVTLLDFSGVTDITTEPLPPPDKRHQPMQWFWDPNHFKSALGEKIIARIKGADSGFGIELTQDNVNDQITGMHDAMARYEQSHPAEVAHTYDLVEQSKDQLCTTTPKICEAQTNLAQTASGQTALEKTTP